MSTIKTNQVLNLDGDRIGSVVVDSIANLKNLNTEIEANATVELLGYYNKGDGGGGTFYWDSTSIEDDNGGTIIEATGVVDGRWIRSYSGAVNVKWFGAVGDEDKDDTVVIQAAFDAGIDSAVYLPAGVYRVTSPLYVNGNCRLFSNAGAEIYYDGVANAGYLIKFVNHKYLELSGIFFKGQGKVRNIVEVLQDTAADIASSTLPAARAFIRDCKFTYANQWDDNGSSSALRIFGKYTTLTLDNLYVYGVSANEPTVTTPVCRGIYISAIDEPGAGENTRNSRDIKVTNCHIENVVASNDADCLVLVSDTNDYIYGNALISNNHFKTYGKRAIKSQIYSGVISNNFFERTAAGQGTGINDVSTQLGGFVVDGNRFEYALNEYLPAEGVVKLSGDASWSVPHVNPSVISNNVINVVDDQTASPANRLAPFWITNQDVKDGAIIIGNTISGRWDTLVQMYLAGQSSKTDYPLSDINISNNIIHYALSLVSLMRSGGSYAYVNNMNLNNNTIIAQSTVEALEYEATGTAFKNLRASMNKGVKFDDCIRNITNYETTVSAINGGMPGYENDLMAGSLISIFRRTATGTILTIGRRKDDGTTVRTINFTDVGVNPQANNTIALGSSSYAYKDIYSVNAPITTSDEREKTQVRPLNEVEKAVGIKLKNAIKMFKWIDAVEEKGEAARLHTGVMAQEVVSIFESEGLNAYEYGIITYTEWEQDEEHEVAGNRFGVRYQELLAFIIGSI